MVKLKIILGIVANEHARRRMGQGESLPNELPTRWVQIVGTTIALSPNQDLNFVSCGASCVAHAQSVKHWTQLATTNAEIVYNGVGALSVVPYRQENVRCLLKT